MNMLLVSHGGLSRGALEAYGMFAPGAEGVSALGLTEEEGVDAFAAALAAKVEELVAQGDLLIVADLQGGTPYNQALIQALTYPEHVRLAAGLNLPMLIEAGMLMSCGGSLDEVYQTALRAGAEGVVGTDLDDED